MSDFLRLDGLLIIINNTITIITEAISTIFTTKPDAYDNKHCLNRELTVSPAIHRHMSPASPLKV